MPDFAVPKEANPTSTHHRKFEPAKVFEEAYFFSASDGTFASRKNLADSSGGVGLI